MPCIRSRHNGQYILVQVVILDASRISGLQGTVLPSPPQQFTALVDTGAEKTMISTNVIDTLGLQSVGTIPIQNVGPDLSYHRGFLFHLGFLFGVPENIFKPKVEGVAQAELNLLPDPIFGAEIESSGDLFDVLLGMDVIGTGEMHIGGDGNFSFSI